MTKKKNLGLLFIVMVLLALSFILPTQYTEKESKIATATPSFTVEPHFEVTIPSKALLKNYVVVSVKATAGTSCNLIFIPASGEMINMDTIADESGECMWKWKLEESYGRGHARLIFTIDGTSETHFLQILPEF